MKKFFPFLLMLPALLSLQPSVAQSVSSPDGSIKLDFKLLNGVPSFSVTRDQQLVLPSVALGIQANNIDFTRQLQLVKTEPVKRVTDDYTLMSAKKSQVHYEANERTVYLKTAGAGNLSIIFRVSNDGIGFCYRIPGTQSMPLIISHEKTAYQFPADTRTFLQPKAEAQTGWNHTNPSYEEHYLQNAPLGTVAPMKSGWVYPALFKVKDTWLLFTESGMVGDYAATHLENDSGSNVYRVAYPDPREVIPGDLLISNATLPWQSPWRIIGIGSLKTIVESTLGTDLAPAAKPGDWSWVQPGIASWSWINSKDDFIIYPEQKKYIDFAASMGWKYCLVDADWDRKIGYDSIASLAKYAAAKNVGLILWYNSAGNWNTVPYTPKGLLTTHEGRVKEFSRLQAMGIKGVKIDFFGGDGVSFMRYYNDIMTDAARYQLTTNFHGATLPRGWARTYPNLMTMESVRGFEFITFGQADADGEATHAAMLPFTRNAFDPMDFTPMNLYKIQARVKRATSSAFELATTVLFLSGVQHMAESPEGMAHVPDFVQEYLRHLPTHWDETRFIDGFPGKLVVLARRSGGHWYVAGINGENTSKTIGIDLSWLGGRQGTLITDGAEPLSFMQQSMKVAAGKTEIKLLPNGGFVMVF